MSASQVRAAVEDAFRDFTVAGNPASGAHDPVKGDIRYALGPLLETTLSAIGSGLLRFATTAVRDANTTSEDGQLAYVYRNNDDPDDPDNGYSQWNEALADWEAADWLTEAVAGGAQSLVNAAAPNLVSDVFLRRVSRRPYIGMDAYFGTPLDRDVASAYPNGGSLASVSGLIRRARRLDDTPFKIGDTISVRLDFTTNMVVDTALEFRDAAGSIISSVAGSGASGANDKTLSGTIPANTVFININISAVGSVTKLFALAYAFAPTNPLFVEGATLTDLETIFSALAGEQIALCGDSIPGNTIDVSATPDLMMDMILGQHLSATVTNIAIGGSTLATNAGDANWTELCFQKMAAAVRAQFGGSATAFDAAEAAAVAVGGGDTSTKVARWKAMDWINKKLLIVMLGVNDYGNNLPIGTATDTTGATVYGAINKGVEDMRAAYPHLQILICTPAYRDRFFGGAGTMSVAAGVMTVSAFPGGQPATVAVGSTIYAEGIVHRTNVASLGTGTGGTGTYNLNQIFDLSSRPFAVADPTSNGDDFNNSVPAKLTDYADAIRIAAQRNHLPCLDFYRELGLNKGNATRLLGDGLHPSSKIGLYYWAEFLARGVAQHIRTVL